MAIALVTSASATNASTATTAGITTTGADLLVVVVAYTTAGGLPAVSDSKSNSWTGLTAQTSGAIGTQIFYSIPSSVGASHTFTVATSGTNTISAMAFSGANATQGTPQESGAATGSGTSLAPGSVTPSEDNELVILGVTMGAEEDDTFAIDSGFTVAEFNSFVSGTNYGSGAGYKVQTTAAAVNPSASWTTAVLATARMATFKAGSAVVAGFDAPFPFFLGLMGGTTYGGATYAFPVVSGRTNRIFRHITPVAGVLR